MAIARLLGIALDGAGRGAGCWDAGTDDKGLASAFFGTGRFFSDTHHTADMAPPTKMGCIT